MKKLLLGILIISIASIGYSSDFSDLEKKEILTQFIQFQNIIKNSKDNKIINNIRSSTMTNCFAYNCQTEISNLTDCFYNYCGNIENELGDVPEIALLNINADKLKIENYKKNERENVYTLISGQFFEKGDIYEKDKKLDSFHFPRKKLLEDSLLITVTNVDHHHLAKKYYFFRLENKILKLYKVQLEGGV